MSDVSAELAAIKSILVGVEKHQRKARAAPPSYAMTITLAAGAELARAAGNNVLADKLLQRAASAPATTTGVGWAAEIASQPSAQLILLASHSSAWSAILARSPQVGSLGQSQRSVVVMAQPNPAKLIAEGEPIPLAKGALSSLPALPHKLASLVSFTGEAGKRSNVATVCRALLQQSLALGLDEAAFTASGPLGIFSGLTPIPGEATPIEDTKALLAALIEPSADTVFVVHPARWPLFAASAGPTFPYSVVPSTAVGDGLVAIDPQGIAAGIGEAVIDISKESTAHFDDAPAALMTAGPVRSGWQTDALVMRTLLDLTWAKRAGSVALVDQVSW